MTDTHTHIYLPEEYEGTNEAVIGRAMHAGVSRFVFPNIDLESIAGMLELHRRHPEYTYFAAGLHPTEVKEDWRDVLEKCMECASEPGCVAIGETGIDLYWDKTYRPYQTEAFRTQLMEGVKRGLPVIIHCREALDDVLDAIRSLGGEQPAMVFHSFTGSVEEVRRIREVADPYFGINGVVTFKNAKPLREALTEIGADRILLETDSPYLSPAPYRGKRNESGRLPLILEAVAATLKRGTDETERITDRNASLFFRI